MGKTFQPFENLEFSDVTEKIIGCAYRVYNKMGFGFLESVYEKCLLIELKKQALTLKPRNLLRFFTMMKS